MNEAEFQSFLKQGRRSPSATKRVIAHVREFQSFLQEKGLTLAMAKSEDLQAFVEWIEGEPKTSAKTHLWALRYYYQFTGNEELEYLASALRQERIQRKPFALKDFRGVQSGHVKELAAAGIKNVNQMLRAGRTPADRDALAAKTDVPLESILELVKLSDLARIPGVKGIRARLYVEAGVDTVEKMTPWDPEELRAMIVKFVEESGFDGVPTLLAEAKYTIQKAQKLPKIVVYE